MSVPITKCNPPTVLCGPSLVLFYYVRTHTKVDLGGNLSRSLKHLSILWKVLKGFGPVKTRNTELSKRHILQCLLGPDKGSNYDFKHKENAGESLPPATPRTHRRLSTDSKYKGKVEDKRLVSIS